LKPFALLPGDIFARVRAGETGARNEIIAAFDRGIRFVLGQRLEGNDLDKAAADVHEQVLLAITNRLIAETEELPGCVRAIVKARIAGKTNGQPSGVDAQAVTNIQQTMSATDLEVLHRYYVLGESPAHIGGVLGINVAAIQAIKQRARQAYLNSPEISSRRVA
jgi:DNA-directed RNA polymerase specialized sigma24 family protein